jgi:hypothetical protein
VTPWCGFFYRYSTDPLLARYNLSFVELGIGKGNYIPISMVPMESISLCSTGWRCKTRQFEPVQILVAPKRQQIVNLGMDYKIKPGTILKAEIATSNNDVNTFSTKDDGDDRGGPVNYS